MNAGIKRTLTALAVACVAGTATLPAVAGGDHYNRHSHKHYGKHYAPPHHYKHARPHYRRHNSDDDEKLVYGLLVGGLIGYALSYNQQPDYSARQYSYSPPPAAPAYPQPAQATTCLQEREYQMKVIVGGREADAYGTACLQPDGSWHRGPAQVVSR